MDQTDGTLDRKYSGWLKDLDARVHELMFPPDLDTNLPPDVLLVFKESVSYKIVPVPDREMLYEPEIWGPITQLILSNLVVEVYSLGVMYSTPAIEKCSLAEYVRRNPPPDEKKNKQPGRKA